MQGSRSWTRAAVSPAGSCSQSTAHTAVSCTGQWWHDYMTSLGAQESNLFTASKIYNNSMEAFIQPREHLQYLNANRTDVTTLHVNLSCHQHFHSWLCTLSTSIRCFHVDRRVTARANVQLQRGTWACSRLQCCSTSGRHQSRQTISFS